MTFYDEMRGVADELLTEFAQGVVKITKVTPGTPNPAQPWVPTMPTAETATLAATVRRVEQKYVDGTLIVGTEDQVMFALPAFVPDMSCEMSVDGRVRVMKDLRPIPAAGAAVAFVAFVGG
jgi:hypothetical protein